MTERLKAVDADLVRSMFTYRDGDLWWRQKTSNRVDTNRPAGNISATDGYRRIGLKGHSYRAHRLIWMHVYGRWPNGEIDHIDGNRLNNHIENLREVTRHQNGRNLAKKSSNTSGHKGVTWSKAAGKWAAQISPNRRNVHLGLFDCPAAASFAYQIASDKHFGEYARYR